MGPLIDKANVDRVNAVVEAALAAGAKPIVRGGPVTEGPLAKGAFYRPTLLEIDDPGLDIAQKETFGPVLTLQTFDSERDAVELANDSEYGLGASIWTRDIDRSLRIARELDAGTVWINDWAVVYDEFEEGGFKQSGLGRLNGVAAMDQSVLHQRVEDIAHRRRAALDGEDVKFASWRTTVAHLPRKKFMHDTFAATQHPARHGIKIADDSLPEFVGERFRIELEFVDAKVPSVVQQFDAGGFGIRLKECLETSGEAGSFRDLPARVGNGQTAPGFFEAKTKERAEGVARRGADPVRVAATGVEELGHVIAFGHFGEFDQFIFQLERTEFK